MTGEVGQASPAGTIGRRIGLASNAATRPSAAVDCATGAGSNGAVEGVFRVGAADEAHPAKKSAAMSVKRRPIFT